MTHIEWYEAMKWLYQELKKADDTFLFDIAVDDVNRRIPIKGGFRINIRVSLTEKLVKQYDLTKYKQNNYMIEVTA